MVATPLSPTLAHPLRIMIVDPHVVVRMGFTGIISAEPDLTVIGEAATGNAALAQCENLRPDIVLLDIALTGPSGLETARLIRQTWSQIKIIILAANDDPAQMIDAFEAGATGYLLKGATREEIIAAVRQVNTEGLLLSPALASQLMQTIHTEVVRPVPTMRDHLTQREQEVLSYLIQGYTNRAIGERLFVSTGTVKTHVARIIAKLGVADRTQAAARATEMGLSLAG